VLASVGTILTLPFFVGLALDQQSGVDDVAVSMPLGPTVALLLGVVLVPVTLGMLVRRRAPHRAAPLERAVSAFGGAVLVMDANIPQGTANALEFAVGVMLVLLGLDVLRRAYRQKTHFHVHRHTDGVVHFHAHSHAHDPAPHDTESHRHVHAKAFPLRALAVGMMHGMAGSAALLLLTARAAESVPLGLLQIAVFGVGSMLGMGVLSAVIALPLQGSVRWTAGAHLALQWVVGVFTAGLGAVVMVQTAVGS